MRYEPSPSLPPPQSKIGLVHVKHLRAMTAALRAVDYRYGGGSCRTQVQALLSWCDKAFAHSASAAVRRDFGSAIAELHALAGWTAFDAGLGGSAHRHFHLALNFAQAIPHFAISIALRSQGAIRVGVVYDPCRDELFQATVDGPAMLNDQVIFVQQISEGLEAFAKAVVGTDWPFSGERRDLAVRMMSLFSEQVTECNAMGSPALGLCYVAAGRTHAYWHLDLKIWDVAAASLILQRAGGTLTDADGVTWLYSNGGYIASNSIIHGWTLRTITAVLMQPKPPVPRDHDRGAHPPS